ncbi:hypothetical protein EVA_04257 [gut metagenome]|uniref:Uncharacterized protein n=1 Tax=gut metagenome TaxID=749906 RepID=J9D4N9_9ZZZZ
MDNNSLLGSYLYLLAFLSLRSDILKQISRNHYKTAVTSFCNFFLQLLGKVIITLTGNDSQHIRIKNSIT